MSNINSEKSDFLFLLFPLFLWKALSMVGFINGEKAFSHERASINGTIDGKKSRSILREVEVWEVEKKCYKEIFNNSKMDVL